MKSVRAKKSQPLERNVRERARHRCEVCRIPAFVPNSHSFPIDHIIARQHGGETTLDHLALSCPHCNFHKGPNIGGLDPVSRRLTPLFYPRRNRWGSHFAWAGPVLVARTAVGRTTLHVLAMNHPDRVELRRLLIEAGVF